MINHKSPVALQLAVYALLGVNFWSVAPRKILTPLLPCPMHEDLIVCRINYGAPVTCTGLLPQEVIHILLQLAMSHHTCVFTWWS